jgi:hypothetical protein
MKKTYQVDGYRFRVGQRWWLSNRTIEVGTWLRAQLLRLLLPTKGDVQWRVRRVWRLR